MAAILIDSWFIREGVPEFEFACSELCVLGTLRRTHQLELASTMH